MPPHKPRQEIPPHIPREKLKPAEVRDVDGAMLIGDAYRGNIGVL